MKKKKIITLLCLMLFCGGWESNYYLDFDKGILNEKVVVSLDEDIYKVVDSYGDNIDIAFIEADLVYNDYLSLYRGDKLYKKEIKKGNTIVELTYSYSFDEFKNARYANFCFNNFYAEEADEYYYIRAYGKFKCSDKNLSEVNIKTSAKTVVNDRAIKNQDGSYTWEITNDDLNDIEIKIYKAKYDFKYLYIFISFSILIIIIIFIKKFKDANEF